MEISTTANASPETHASSECLNCLRPIAENHCAHCGQKTSTHRYSLKHFVVHDLVHGIWHVDNGILFTLKALFTRPGHSVREYLAGKRAGFFNFFTLLLIILGIGHFLNSYSTIKIADLVSKEARATTGAMEAFFEKYPKASLVLTIPVYSVFSFVWFRRAKLNLTEHFVLNSYKTAAESVFTLLFTLLLIFYSNVPVLSALYPVLSIVAFTYAVWFYYQFFSQAGYSKKALIWRSLAVPLTYTLFYIIAGAIAAIISKVSGHN